MVICTGFRLDDCKGSTRVYLTKTSIRPLGFTRKSPRNHVPKMLRIFLTLVWLRHCSYLICKFVDCKQKVATV